MKYLLNRTAQLASLSPLIIVKKVVWRMEYEVCCYAALLCLLHQQKLPLPLQIFLLHVFPGSAYGGGWWRWTTIVSSNTRNRPLEHHISNPRVCHYSKVAHSCPGPTQYTSRANVCMLNREFSYRHPRKGMKEHNSLECRNTILVEIWSLRWVYWGSSHDK